MKTVVSLTVNFTQERMPWLLSVCGNDKHFQQQRTLHKGRHAAHSDSVLTACEDLTGWPLGKSSDTSISAFEFHWLWFYPTNLANQQNICILVPKITASSFSLIFQGRVFWKDILPHTHMQRLIACTGVYGWMYG